MTDSKEKEMKIRKQFPFPQRQKIKTVTDLTKEVQELHTKTTKY